MRWSAGAALAVLVAALLLNAADYWQQVLAVLRFPFGLDYGEGIVWQQALLIPGPAMYGPISDLPLIVFHYPPVYHLVTRLVGAAGVDLLLAGRIVSVVSAVGIGTACAWIALRATWDQTGALARTAAAVTAFLLPLSLAPLFYWSLLMRVDTLGVFLCFVGTALVIEAWRRPWLFVPAMLAFVLAVYTRQTLIAAPCAALAVSLWVRTRPALLAAAGGALLGAAVFLLLEWQTGGGFARHVILYNINAFSLRLLWWALNKQAPYLILLGAAAAALCWFWWDSERRDAKRLDGIPTRPVLVLFAAWLCFAGLMTVTAGKVGANVNYFIEALCAAVPPVAMLVAVGCQALRAAGAGGTLPSRSDVDAVSSAPTGSAASPDVVDRPRMAGHDKPGSKQNDRGNPTAGPGCDANRRALVLHGLLLGVCVGLIVQMTLRRPPYAWLETNAAMLADREALVRDIVAAGRPVLTDQMDLLLRAGQPVLIEPAIFTQLAAGGLWDESAFIRQINAGAFAFVVLRNPKGLFTPAMLAAIKRTYPVEDSVGEFVVRRMQAR